MTDWQTETVFEEIARRKSALHSLEKFRAYMEPSGHSDYIHPFAAHHKAMAQALEHALFGERKKVMIFCPPGAAKSTLVKQACMLYWANNPTHHIIRVSATQALAERFARQCRSALAEPHYRRLSGTTLDPGQQSVASFANSRGGSMTSAGVGTSIVGLRAHLAVIDDPVASWEQVHSDSQRQAQIDWYWAEYRSRHIPGAPEILVTTRWHHQDLAGVILEAEPDQWEVIRLPLLCDDPANDPLGRDLHALLWPEWYTPEMVTEAKRDPEIWSGLYQQTPLHTKGDFLAPGDLQIVDEIPQGLTAYAALDLALTEKQSADATAIVIGGMAADGTLYILHAQQDRVSPERTIQNLQQLHDQWQFAEVLIEDSPAEKVFRDLCHKLFRQSRRYLPLMPMPTRGRDKMARLQPLRGLAKMGGVKLHRGPWNAEVVRACVEFPYGKHDDLPDALGLLGRRASRMVQSAVPKSYEPPPPIEGAITIGPDGRRQTRATLNELWDGHDLDRSRRNILRI